MDIKSRVTTIDALRGLAALSVCWYHFTNGGELLQEGWLRTSGSFGWLGVECFFVISGFVIPLSMYRVDFKVKRDWKTFFGKRIFRIDPPYFVSIAITLGLWYVSSMIPGFAGQAPTISFIQLFGHIGYLNAFIGYDWINPVYWTLAIEFQYYILIAFLYVFISSPDVRIRWVSTLGLGFLSLFPTGNEYILHYMAIFSLGIIAFQYHVGMIKREVYFLLLVILSIISFLSLGNLIAIIGCSTSLAIMFLRIRIPKILSFYGMISYSMYLFHVPIGGRIINLGRRFAHTLPTQILVLILALVVTSVSAYLIYLYIERPSQAWSAALKYKSQSTQRLKLKT